jgi:hypothetical protein
MRARSLEILGRTVMVATDPRHTPAEVDDIVHDTGVAARVALADLTPEQAEIRTAHTVDREKFDMDDAATAG